MHNTSCSGRPHNLAHLPVLDWFVPMKLLLQIEEGDHRIRVIEAVRDGSRRYYDGPALYTEVDASGENRLGYIAAMSRAITGAQSLLLLGTAGGALATKFSRAGRSVTAVDNCAIAFSIARNWFHMPETVECICEDAVAFLRTNTRQWDAVAVDIFCGTDIPDAMLAGEVGKLLANAVSANGIIVWNVADSQRSWAVHMVQRVLRVAGFKPYVVPVLDRDVGNTLVVCRNSRQRFPHDAPTSSLAA